MHDEVQQGTAAIADFQRQTDSDMGRMMADMHGPGYTGDPDIDFLVMMVPHHQGAVDMARLVLIYGRDPLTRSIAEDIIAAQHTEIEAMSARLEVLRSGAGDDFPDLTGLRGGSGN